MAAPPNLSVHHPRHERAVAQATLLRRRHLLQKREDPSGPEVRKHMRRDHQSPHHP